MKTHTTILFLSFLLLLMSCKEQNTVQIKLEAENQTSNEIENDTISEEKIKTNITEEKSISEDPMNLLDVQAKVYTDILGNLGGVEELQGIDGFMDLVNKMDATPEIKKQLTDRYELYSTSLDPDKKAALKAQVLKLLKQ